MSIPVVCPGCKKSFRVSDKFAGQTGPCPKCKTQIQIPEKTDEVVVHTPDVHGGTDSKGWAIAKPLKRLEANLDRNVMIIAAGATFILFLAAWLMGPKFHDKLAARGVVLLMITPPLAAGCYFFLRDAEKLIVFGGMDLIIRTAICAAVYLTLWAAYGFVYTKYGFPVEVWQLFIIVPSMVVLGALGALACYELEFGSAVLHYCFHVVVVLALCYVAGMGYLLPDFG